MQKWIVKGTHTETGKAIKGEVDAETETEARQKAERKGVVVKEIITTAPAIDPPRKPLPTALQKLAAEIIEPDSPPVQLDYANANPMDGVTSRSSERVDANPARATFTEQSAVAFAVLVFLVGMFVGGVMLAMGEPTRNSSETIYEHLLLQISDAQTRIVGVILIVCSLIVMFAAVSWQRNRIITRQMSALIDLTQRLANREG